MGFLKMAACCAGPILLLAALPFLGGTLGVGGSALLSTAAILACPLGMGWMMWRMSRQQAVTSGQNHAPVSLEAGASEELKKEVRS